MANVSLYLISTAVLFLMGSLVKAINSNVFDSSVGEMISCGVADPTEADRIARDSAFSFQKFQSRHRRQSDEGKLLFGSSPEDVRTVIPVCFHAPSNIFNRILRRQHATDREIQQQLDHLNEAFSAKSCCDSKLFWCTDGECSVDTNIRFALAVTDRFGRLVAGETTENTRDPRACITRKIRLRTRVIQGSRRERRIYSRLRKGDSSVLNIYLLKVQRSAVLPIIDGGYLLGSATFPWDYIHDPLMDGVVVRPNTLTGGSFPTKTEGDTLVHEIGHWLGLFHTFEFGCESGDFVADTAPEDSFARDCPIGRNTCRLSPEPDPIHNFLDYTSDACQYRFTQGQADVMQANVEAYRSGGDDPINLPPVILANGVKSEPYTLVTGRPRFFELPHVSENSTLFCQADADNGILNLFVNWDGSLVDFDCKAESDRTTEECFAYGGPGTLYAMVYAGATVVNFTVECTALDVLNTSALSDSVASAGFNIAAESMQPFTLDTSPETEINEVECSTRADSGQVVLAMGWESDIGRLDCISSNGALTERCQLGPAFAETAYAWAFAVATTSGVSITCRKNSIQAIELFDGTPSTSNSLSENESLLFFLRVDGDSVGFVVCNTEANNGNIDLRMNWDAGFQFDCISQSPSSIESCYIGPDSGLAFIGVVAQETTVDFSLACEFEGPISLANDVKSSQYNVEEDRFRLFTLDVPATSSVHCRTSGRHGDLDLFMNWDGVTGSYLCRSETSSSSEACFLGPGSGTAYAYVYGYEATQRFRITCTIIEG